MKNRILYLHGFRSSPASFKGKLMEQALAERGLSHIWAAPQLPASPKAAIDLALGLAQAQLKEDNEGPGNDPSKLTVIGSSLGGYYATWLADAKAGKTPAPSASTPPGATTIDLSANQLAFDLKTMQAPAGQRFVIHFTNKEAVQHNVSIYDSSGKALFTGQIITSSSVDYQVPALPAGTYTFQCDVHPQLMFGTLTVQ